MIAVILPSRGLVFAEVEYAIEKMRLAHDIVVFRSWDKDIPDAQNSLIKVALETDAEYFLFIEEDTVPPDNALFSLLALNTDIAFIDYWV